MITKVALVAAVAATLFVTAGAFAATPKPKYALKRIPMGPRPDRYVLVRVDRRDRAERPYRLTGHARHDRHDWTSPHRVPSHPKGTH